MGSHYLGPWRVDIEWRDGVERVLPQASALYLSIKTGKAAMMGLEEAMF